METLSQADSWIEFFIRAEDVGAWSLDGLPKLVSAYAQIEQAEALSRLSKAVIAFVRHGHGEETIDESGEWSKDERRDWLKRRQARKQQENATSVNDRP